MKIKLFSIFILFLSIASHVFSQSMSPDSLINIQAQKYKFILETIARNYPDSTDLVKISEKALNYLLQSIDIDCLYFSERQNKLVKDSQRGATVGIGANFIILNDTITITNVVEKSPAELAGMLSGDKILFIDGKSALGLAFNDAIGKFQGDSGTTVSIIIKRGGGRNLIEMTLQRREVALSSVSSVYIIENTDVGYICFNRFSAESAMEFKEEIKNLKEQGMKSLILDLRGNPGGWLDQVCKMADEFLPAGELLTYTKAKNKDFDFKYNTEAGGMLEDIPVIVLIDRNSASGSEIIAGAVQDLDRGYVVGETSYGKATAQRMWEFRDGSGFKLTVAGYFTPSGRQIQKPHPTENEVSLDPAAKLNMDKNALDNLQSALARTEGRFSLPMHKSKGGRDIIGGGGIVPDYFVKNDTLTMLTRVLKEKAFFLEYSHLYLQNAGASFREKYKSDFRKFSKDFDVSEDILNDFKQFSVSRKIWNEQMFQTDRTIISTYIKASIAAALFGNNGFAYVVTRLDKTINKAVEAMPEAAKMFNK